MNDNAIEMQNNAADTPSRGDDGSTQATPADPIGLRPADDDLPMVDQPDPNTPLQAVPESLLPTGDALLVLALDPQDAAGLHLTVMFDTEKPSPNNVAHFFAKWVSDNYPALLKMAAREFNALQALRESEDRHRLRLVSPSGGIIVASD